MIKYSNLNIVKKLDFQDYLNINAYSYSYLKNENNGEKKEIKETDKIKLGKLVDAILTDNVLLNYNQPLHYAAKKIADKIKDSYKNAFNYLETQVSFTATATYNNVSMLTKGRVDFYFKDLAIIDLKVTHEKNIKALIDFMQYENQLWHYCKALDVPNAYLLIYSVPLQKLQLLKVNVSNNTNDFWENKILKFGDI